MPSVCTTTRLILFRTVLTSRLLLYAAKRLPYEPVWCACAIMVTAHFPAVNGVKTSCVTYRLLHVISPRNNLFLQLTHRSNCGKLLL